MTTSPPSLPAFGKKQRAKDTAATELCNEAVYTTIKSNCAPFDEERYSDGSHTLYFLPEAATELFHYLRYGKRRACNVYEQQFIGMGHDFIDKQGVICMVVSRIIPIFSPSRGPTHAKVISEGNDIMLEILENERRIQNELEVLYNVDEAGYTIDPLLGYGPSKVILFGHTHPDLSCFFSSVDHRSNYSTPTNPIVTFVCDPIRQDMKAMVGTGCDSMRIVVCRPRVIEDGAPEATTESLVCAGDELWQQLGAISNLLLLRPGVRGSYDCYRDWKNRAHISLEVVYTPSATQTTK